MKAPDRKTVSQLEELPNIGKAIGKDLRLIGVEHPQELIGKNAFQLYNLLCNKKGRRIDHCVIDVFMSVIHYMEGSESQPWWAFTEERKRILNEKKRCNEMNEHGKINYVEFQANDIQATKEFFSQAFGWSFQDFGPEYSAFSNQGIDGGFYKAELSSSVNNGAALIVIYSQELEATKTKIEKANGIIVKPIFTFPGGRRFHFTEPSGNEFAVWSDKNA